MNPLWGVTAAQVQNIKILEATTNEKMPATSSLRYLLSVRVGQHDVRAGGFLLEVAPGGSLVHIGRPPAGRRENPKWRTNYSASVTF